MRALSLSARRYGVVLAAALALSTLSVPAFATVTGPALRGVVLLPDGSPAPGAFVTLTVMRGLSKPTTPYVETPEATTTADSLGNFALPLTLNPDLVSLALANDGYLNYQVFASYRPAVTGTSPTPNAPSMTTIYNAFELLYASVNSSGLTTGPEETLGYVLSVPDPVRLETTAESAVYHYVPPSYTAGGGVDVTGTLDHTNDPDYSCQNRHGPNVTRVGFEAPLEPVGEIHTGYDTTADVDYGVHANTDLSGAYSYSGGPFKVTAGMNHMGNKEVMTGGSYPEQSGWVYRTAFEYTKEKLEWTNDAGDGKVCWTDYRVVPNGWAGHSWMDGDYVYRDSNYQDMVAACDKQICGRWKADAHWSKHTARGKKYTAGVTAFGVKLAAQSTYSNQLNMEYTFGHGTSYEHILYNVDYKLEDAPVVYAW